MPPSRGLILTPNARLLVIPRTRAMFIPLLSQSHPCKRSLEKYHVGRICKQILKKKRKKEKKTILAGPPEAKFQIQKDRGERCPTGTDKGTDIRGGTKLWPRKQISALGKLRKSWDILGLHSCTTWSHPKYRPELNSGLWLFGMNRMTSPSYVHITHTLHIATTVSTSCLLTCLIGQMLALSELPSNMPKRSMRRFSRDRFLE